MIKIGNLAQIVLSFLDGCLLSLLYALVLYVNRLSPICTFMFCVVFLYCLSLLRHLCICTTIYVYVYQIAVLRAGEAVRGVVCPVEGKAAVPVSGISALLARSLSCGTGFAKRHLPNF